MGNTESGPAGPLGEVTTSTSPGKLAKPGSLAVEGATPRQTPTPANDDGRDNSNGSPSPEGARTSEPATPAYYSPGMSFVPPMAPPGYGYAPIHPTYLASKSYEGMEIHTRMSALGHPRSEDSSTVFGGIPEAEQDEESSPNMSLMEASAAVFHLLAEAEAAEDGYVMASADESSNMSITQRSAAVFKLLEEECKVGNSSTLIHFLETATIVSTILNEEAASNGMPLDYSKILLTPADSQSVTDRSAAVFKMLDEAQSTDGRSISERSTTCFQLLDGAKAADAQSITEFSAAVFKLLDDAKSSESVSAQEKPAAISRLLDEALSCSSPKQAPTPTSILRNNHFKAPLSPGARLAAGRTRVSSPVGSTGYSSKASLSDKSASVFKLLDDAISMTGKATGKFPAPVMLPARPKLAVQGDKMKVQVQPPRKPSPEDVNKATQSEAVAKEIVQAPSAEVVATLQVEPVEPQKPIPEKVTKFHFQPRAPASPRSPAPTRQQPRSPVALASPHLNHPYSPPQSPHQVPLPPQQFAQVPAPIYHPSSPYAMQPMNHAMPHMNHGMMPMGHQQYMAPHMMQMHHQPYMMHAPSSPVMMAQYPYYPNANAPMVPPHSPQMQMHRYQPPQPEPLAQVRQPPVQRQVEPQAPASSPILRRRVEPEAPIRQSRAVQQSTEPAAPVRSPVMLRKALAKPSSPVKKEPVQDDSGPPPIPHPGSIEHIDQLIGQVRESLGKPEEEKLEPAQASEPTVESQVEDSAPSLDITATATFDGPVVAMDEEQLSGARLAAQKVIHEAKAAAKKAEAAIKAAAADKDPPTSPRVLTLPKSATSEDDGEEESGVEIAIKTKPSVAEEPETVALEKSQGVDAPGDIIKGRSSEDESKDIPLHAKISEETPILANSKSMDELATKSALSGESSPCGVLSVASDLAKQVFFGKKMDAPIVQRAKEDPPEFVKPSEPSVDEASNVPPDSSSTLDKDVVDNEPVLEMEPSKSFNLVQAIGSTLSEEMPGLETPPSQQTPGPDQPATSVEPEIAPQNAPSEEMPGLVTAASDTVPELQNTGSRDSMLSRKAAVDPANVHTPTLDLAHSRSFDELDTARSNLSAAASTEDVQFEVKAALSQDGGNFLAAASKSHESEELAIAGVGPVAGPLPVEEPKKQKPDVFDILDEAKSIVTLADPEHADHGTDHSAAVLKILENVRTKITDHEERSKAETTAEYSATVFKMLEDARIQAASHMEEVKKTGGSLTEQSAAVFQILEDARVSIARAAEEEETGVRSSQEDQTQDIFKILSIALDPTVNGEEKRILKKELKKKKPETRTVEKVISPVVNTISFNAHNNVEVSLLVRPPYTKTVVEVVPPEPVPTDSNDVDDPGAVVSAVRSILAAASKSYDADDLKLSRDQQHILDGMKKNKVYPELKKMLSQSDDEADDGDKEQIEYESDEEPAEENEPEKEPTVEELLERLMTQDIEVPEHIDLEFVDNFDRTFNEFVGQNPNFLIKNPDLVHSIRVAKLQKLLEFKAQHDKELKLKRRAAKDDKKKTEKKLSLRLKDASRSKATCEAKLQMDLNQLQESTKKMKARLMWELVSLSESRAKKQSDMKLKHKMANVGFDRDSIILQIPEGADGQKVRNCIAPPTTTVNKLSEDQLRDLRHFQVSNAFLNAEVTVLKKKLEYQKIAAKKHAWIDSVLLRLDKSSMRKLHTRFLRESGVKS